MASISKRQDGTWLGQVNKQGKRKSFYGKTKKEVEKKIQEYMEDVNTYGSELKNTSITLSNWAYKHLFTNVISNVAASTFDRYKSIYDIYIKNKPIGNMSINEIYTLELQEHFNKLTHLSKDSMVKQKILLKGVFDSAIDNHMIRVNPVVSVKIPKSEVKKKTIEVLTIQEQKDYVKAMKNEKHWLLFYVTLFTGMRLGEVIGLKWKYIDFNKNTINIAETIKRSRVFTHDGNFTVENVTKEPKTEASKREIPIPSELVLELKKHKLQSNSEYVFSTSTGKSLLARNVRSSHDRICKNANIKHINFHALRHTYATRLFEIGENFKTVQNLLGHSDIQTTMNVYTHVLENTKTKAVDKLDLILKEMH